MGREVVGFKKEFGHFYSKNMKILMGAHALYCLAQEFFLEQNKSKIEKF
jgi:hypothetical protein